ncbi:LuxR family transcriptional regulator [Microbispora corallina]|uniref:LuxR family transcriptional regulator n=1 Tax=Microbispora corallina TaxID=83302 RepID=A0ABQ4G0M8_9ACTN|nr:LuxR C-terminal-related transcriptional regulator [Microbispora corallina]GIH40518.1 LuxR family transcriptional regulator [Microbispora corallina]
MAIPAALVRQIGNLPADLTSFVGRRRELAEIRRLLSVSRLVTLTGVGGVGKTRLALRAAAEQHRAFDAVWLVDLTALDDPALVAETVAATLGVQSEINPVDALARVLTGQRTLLVLDNCEHLRDACASFANRLLRGVPDLRILATSRQSLGIIGEHQMRVAPLALPEPGRPLTGRALELYDGVCLFVERASAVVPGFRLTPDTTADVVELCRRLDGIPLAIELAAVRLRALSVGTLVERLTDRYACLTSGSRTVAPRQRTLHALVDWSYQLLSPPERTLWSRMSVFPGHFDLEAVEDVCVCGDVEPEDVLDLIDALLDKSLLLREEHHGEVRYRMLETLREFGRLRLDGPDERRSLARRHRDHYLALLERAAGEWFGPAQAGWFARLRLEQAHLRGALEFCLHERGEADVGLLMAALLYETYWLPNAFYSEGRHWFDLLLKSAPEPTAVRAEALCADAQLAFMQGDTAVAELLVGEGLALAEKLGHAKGLALGSLVSGIAAHQHGDYARAAVLLEEAVAGHTAAGDGLAALVGLLTLAATAGSLGEEDRERRLFERSLALAESGGDSWIRSWVLTVVAVHAWQRGDAERATGLARESLVVGRDFDDRLALATTFEVLGWIFETGRRDASAARMLGVAEELCRAAGVSTQRVASYSQSHERCVIALRERMGERAFDRALRQGERLTLDDAVAEALGSRPDEAPGAEPDERLGEDRPGRGERAGPEPSPLTGREREIAELISQGFSNKEISSALVIAQRTTEGHVEHILTKLGFSSRTQIAAWVTARKAAGGHRRDHDDIPRRPRRAR